MSDFDEYQDSYGDEASTSNDPSAQTGDKSQKDLDDYCKKLIILLDHKVASSNLSERVNELKSSSEVMAQLLERLDITDPAANEADEPEMFQVSRETVQYWVTLVQRMMHRSQQIKFILYTLAQDYPQLEQNHPQFTPVTKGIKEIADLISDDAQETLESFDEIDDTLDYVTEDPAVEDIVMETITALNSYESGDEPTPGEDSN
ncbi:hypothetical protein F5Y11DRAFT_362930 [Daldinia sp. FL1419]|nr:hypothetical protein F5Y11DRAFT_362930 [Daldinia sp. FL1419]